MDLIKTIFPCLPIGGHERSIQIPTTKAKYQPISEKATVQPSTPELCSDEAASRIVTAMLMTEKPGASLDLAIQSLVHQAGGWSEYLAKKILAALETVLKAGKQMKMNAAMQEVCDKACEAAKLFNGFEADHPVATEVFCTVVALGVLVVLAPYVVEWLGFWLGFGEEGPIAGSWAAAWQSRYAGSVPKGSLFSYFQRLGMTWKRVSVN